MKFHQKSVLQTNTFPLFFIDKCVHKFLNKLFVKCNKPQNYSDKKELFISLELLCKLSLQVKKQLAEIFRTCQKNINKHIKKRF